MADSDLVKLSDLIKWLQNNHGVAYMTAHKLTHMYLKDREENAPRVRYTDSGRSGTVHYISKEATLDLSYEFAGGNALAIIDIPKPQNWEAATKTPLSKRDSILNFIGRQVVEDQTQGNGSFEFDEDVLTIYPGKSR